MYVCRQTHGQALVGGYKRRVTEDVVSPFQVVAQLGRHREGHGTNATHERVVLSAGQVWSAPGAAEQDRTVWGKRVLSVVAHTGQAWPMLSGVCFGLSNKPTSMTGSIIDPKTLFEVGNTDRSGVSP